VARRAAPKPTITVIAGTNGAGKSSILGEYLRQHGGEYFNPDEVARTLLQNDPRLSQEDANGLAWSAGKDLLETAIEKSQDYTFETTLGGNTIKRLLQEAATRGHRLVIWYVGLNSPETHIRRVEARVKSGGHGIPETKIRERFTRSLENLIDLLPLIHELRVFDNSQNANLAEGEPPQPQSLLHIRDGKVLESVELTDVPNWAKPLFAACLIQQK
jgi:predicted ABC-type ATPase